MLREDSALVEFPVAIGVSQQFDSAERSIAFFRAIWIIGQFADVEIAVLIASSRDRIGHQRFRRDKFGVKAWQRLQTLRYFCRARRHWGVGHDAITSFKWGRSDGKHPSECAGANRQRLPSAEREVTVFRNAVHYCS